MNVGDIFDLYRKEIDDAVGIDSCKLVPDWQALRYLNDAENEACRRSRLLIDSSTTETVASGTVVIAGASGSISFVTVNGVTITSGSVAFSTDLETTAAALAANINAYTSNPNYTAKSFMDTVTVFAAAGSGATPNGYAIAATTVTLTTRCSPLAGGGPLCSISLVAGTSLYTRNPKLLRIRRAKVASRSLPLYGMTMKEMDDADPGWEARTGTVEALVLGMDTGKFRTYRIPTASDTMTVTGVRLPLVPMATRTDYPEINERFHYSLIHWMKFKTFSVQDSEIYKPGLAKEALEMFENEFGQKSAAYNEAFDDTMMPFDTYDGSW